MVGGYHSPSDSSNINDPVWSNSSSSWWAAILAKDSSQPARWRLDRIGCGWAHRFLHEADGRGLQQTEVYFDGGHHRDGLAVLHAGFEAPFFYGFDGFLVQA